MKNCLRCQHEWQPRMEHPNKCPKCNSRLWDKPKTEYLSGGKLVLYLRTHKDEVLQYCHIHGLPATLEKYNISDSTFDHLASGQYDNARPMIKDNRVEVLESRIEILHSEIAEVRKNQRELESLFNHFVETTSSQISKALILPLLRNALQFEGNLPATDELGVERLLSQAGWRLKNSTPKEVNIAAPLGPD